MLKELYGSYFQKSKSFLYPSLEIARKASIQVSETFIAWEHKYSPEDKRLILVYNDSDNEAFEAFAQKVLMSSPHYDTHFRFESTAAYVFNMSFLGNDWSHFMTGRYSLLSKNLKRSILDFYGKKSKEYPYIASFVIPEDFFEIYSELLNVDESLLRSVGELCDKPDLPKETCQIPVEHLETTAEFI